MKIKLIEIGNSRGIRIPKAMLEEVGLSDRVELTISGDALVLRPAQRRPRQNWDEQIAAVAKSGRPSDEPLLPDYVSAEADESEAW
jgi:antitoxin MazE